MRKAAIIFSLVLFVTSMVLSQSESLTFGQNLRNILNDQITENYSSSGKLSIYNTDFSKNPFIFKEWRYAQIRFKDGKVVDSLLLNYDDKENALLVTLVKGTDPFTLRTTDVTGFTFYESPARPYIGMKNTAFEDLDKAYGFYEQLYGSMDEPGVSVVKGFVKKYRDGDDQVNYGSMSIPQNKFDLHKRYYIKKGEGKYTRITLGKKTIQELIGKSKMKEAQGLIKSKKLKWNDEEALMVIIDSYL